jgi:hypothetical protein
MSEARQVTGLGGRDVEKATSIDTNVVAHSANSTGNSKWISRLMTLGVETRGRSTMLLTYTLSLGLMMLL